MSDEEELSAEEMDALLRDLESRASSSPKSDADVDAFLDEPSEKKTKTKAAPPKKEVELPKESPKAEIQKVEKSEEPAKKDKKSKKSNVKVVSRGTDEELAKKLRLILLCVVTPILLTAAWILGTYLGPIVSAGWLIGVVALVALLVVPLVLWLGVKRGNFLSWTGLISALALVALLAISPSFASKRLIQYGHWPASSIAQIAGWDSDNWLSSANVSVSTWIASLLHTPPVVEGETPETTEARRLGTTDPLTGEPATDADKADGDTEAKPDEKSDKPDESGDEKKNEEKKSDEKPESE